MNIQLIDQYVKNKLSEDRTGHDYMHIKRVLKNADMIMDELDIDDNQKQLVYATILVHDLSDYKLIDDIETAENKTIDLLQTADVKKEDIDTIMYIVRNMSYSSNIEGKKNLNQLGQIVQDADRLDAIGAIGIARTFYYGGSKKSPMYTEFEPNKDAPKSIDEYKKSSSVLEHYYEKLIHISNLMNTDPAKKIAKERHEIMENFFDEFLNDIK